MSSKINDRRLEEAEESLRQAVLGGYGRRKEARPSAVRSPSPTIPSCFLPFFPLSSSLRSKATLFYVPASSRFLPRGNGCKASVRTSSDPHQTLHDPHQTLYEKNRRTSTPLGVHGHQMDKLCI